MVPAKQFEAAVNEADGFGSDGPCLAQRLNGLADVCRGVAAAWQDTRPRRAGRPR